MWFEKQTPAGGIELTKEFRFKDFGEAFIFCTRIALLAEKINHHPSMTIKYNKVIVSTTSHDLGDVITDIDKLLCSEIDNF